MNGECYVYIVLPGETEFVTAGKFLLDKNRFDVPVGKFVYGRSYLAREKAVPIDPFELNLGAKIFETSRLKGIFGALRDAGPDYWGRRVIEKHSGKIQLGELDYLLYSPDDRAGALGFGLSKDPPAPRREFNQTMDLEKLQSLADAVINDEDLLPDQETGRVQELLLLGTSMGGARPKTVVEDKNGLWIAKFNRPDDRWNYARVEHAMLVLARACGIQSAESRVETIGDRDALLVKRFDREKTGQGYHRARMLSALTLLRSEDSYQDRDKWSYPLLVEELRRISSQQRPDAQELFRRMCFNALISNTDDHPRNHSVIAPKKHWRLSPAYDLVPSVPASIEQRDLALICGDAGRYAHARNLLSQSARFMLEPQDAQTIIQTMEQIIADRWYGICRAEGVTGKDCDRISGAFVYPGFRLLLDDNRP